jgi:hypothetical protein
MDLKKYFEKIAKYSQTVATVLLISILLIAVLEGFSFLGITAYHYVSSPEQKVSDLRVNNEVYDNCSWADELFKEFRQQEVQDIPYIGRSRREYSGKYINVDENGLRYTWNSKNSANDPIKIYFFGGSTTWGTGARDNYTIPSLVSKYLFENNISANVTNYGESGYQNTQETIFLMLELQKDIPDVVIFYDGVNDVYSAYQNRKAGLPQHGAVLACKNEYINYVVTMYTEHSYFWKCFTFLKNKLIGARDKSVHASDNAIENKEELAEEVIDVYSHNIKIIHGLEKEYGFKSYFFWQPCLYTKKYLSETEENFIEEQLEIAQLYNFEVNHSHLKLKADTSFIDVSNIFDNHNKTVFIDWCHLGENGNEIVANKIGKTILEDFRERE